MKYGIEKGKHTVTQTHDVQLTASHFTFYGENGACASVSLCML